MPAGQCDNVNVNASRQPSYLHVVGHVFAKGVNVGAEQRWRFHGCFEPVVRLGVEVVTKCQGADVAGMLEGSANLDPRGYESLCGPLECRLAVKPSLFLIQNVHPRAVSAAVIETAVFVEALARTFLVVVFAAEPPEDYARFWLQVRVTLRKIEHGRVDGGHALGVGVAFAAEHLAALV